MRNSGFYVKEISVETTFYSNTRAIWRVACLVVTSFSRISVKDISGIFLILQLRRNKKTDFFSSCVFDLYQFIFTSIDIEVRNRFMADFVCGVYYDSFAKEICQQNKYNLAFLGVAFVECFWECFWECFLFLGKGVSAF